MTNPFEDENGIYHVLINDEGQYCLEFINQNWTDMRPNSLIKSMNESSAGQPQKENPSES